jgi:hypothetical protein
LLLAALLVPCSSLAIDCICLIDEDCIDNGALAIEELANNNVCGNGDPAVCVNDQLANPGVRTPLPLAPGTIIGNAFWPGMGTQAPLSSGQLFDEGLFKLCAAPQSWVDAGHTTDGLVNYLLAGVPGFGIGGEFLLDKIPNVTPMGTAELQAMVGESCCAVVYDSDISINYNPLEGNLQGANLGILHFTLLAVGPDPDGSVLPDITIRVEDPGPCEGVLVSVEEQPWGIIKRHYR